ncbi:MAG: beta strand repeat-containing protein [Lysobacterales bacterium]
MFYRTLRACLLSLTAVGAVAPSHAATFTVVDSGDPVGAGTTLRNAITQANASADVLDLIVFNLPANTTITLASDLPVITDDVLIDGSNVAGLTINGGSAFRIFDIDTAADENVMLTELALVAGAAVDNGGAIRIADNEDVTLTNVSIDGSTAALSGGAVYVGAATLDISGGTFNANIANGSAADEGGGAIYSLGGTVTIAGGASFTANQAAGTSGSGGALLINGGSADIAGGDFTNNASSRAGGGIEIRSSVSAAAVVTDGVAFADNRTGPSPGNGAGVHITAPDSGLTTTMDLSGGSFTGNTAAAEGGGLWNDVIGTVTISSVIITGNTASGAGADQGGGGLFNNGGSLSATASTIDNNLADGAAGSGGGVLNDGGVLALTGGSVSANTANRAGGGIEVTTANARDSLATISNVSFATNVVGSAPGNGGAIHISDPAGDATSSQMEVTGGSFTGNTAAEEGGGLWNAVGGTLIIDGSTITGNTASGAGADQGGGGVFNDGGTVTITGATINTNIADGAAGSGGGVLVNGGTVSVTGGTLSGNSSVRAGGGIEITSLGADAQVTVSDVTVANNATGGSPGNGGGIHITDADGDAFATTTTIMDGSFTGNTAAAEGGALWNAVGGTLSVTGTVITTNTASGALSDQGGGGVFNDGGNVSITNATVDSNTADGAAGSGGGVLNDGGTLVVTGGSVSANSAVRAGGGVEANTRNLRDSTVTLDGVTVSDNTLGSAPGNGGGVHVSNPVGDNVSLFTVIAGTFSGNQATQEGGGLWNDAGGTLAIDGATISGNTATAANAAADAQGGGGIFNNGGTVTIVSAAITGNTVTGALGADDGGGGVLNDARSNPGTVSLRGSTIENNSAGEGSGSGGGILTIGGDLSVTGGSVSANNAMRAGGGIEIRAVEAQATVTTEGVGFRGNTTGAAPGNGGGIHVTAPTTGMTADVTINGGDFASNTAAAEGGALWNDANGALNVDGVNISGNTASGNGADQGGGGLFNNGGTLTLTGVTVSSNVADGAAGSGGGLLNDGGTLNITGGSVSLNSAIRAGGGLEVTTANARSSSVTLANVNFDQNTVGASPGNGGGVHVTDVIGGSSSAMTVVGGSFTGNTAEAEGGGLWNDAGGTLILGGTTISGNTAGGNLADQGGGGVFNNGGNVTIANATINANIADGAAGSGGGILNDGGSLSIAAGSVSGNSAIRAGGGVEITTVNARTSDVLIDGVVLDGNTAGASPGNGGGIHVTDPLGDSASTLTIVGATVTANMADQEGGGLWNDAGGIMTVENSTVSNNVSNAANAAADVQGGGGVFNNGGNITLTDVTLNANSASGPSETDDGGGAIANTNEGSMTVRDSNITSNTADTGSGNGGGVLNTIGSTLQMNNVVFSLNSAARAGGALENVGTASLTGIVATSNSAGINGGMLHISGGGSTTFSDSTINSNSAANEGGGLWVSGDGMLNLSTTGVDGNEALFGGGVFVDAGGSAAGNLTIATSALTNNVGTTNGGGISLEAGTASLVNATVSGNSGGDGGGLFNDAAAATLSFVTMFGNTATGQGGTINNATSGAVTADNTIIAGGVASAGNDIQGTLTSADFLIIQDTAGATVGGATDNSSLDTDPLLGALANNGGPTLSHLPLAGSPAIDGADNSNCPGMDQRNFARNDGACDIGSVEAGSVDPDLIFTDSFEN